MLFLLCCCSNAQSQTASPAPLGQSVLSRLLCCRCIVLPLRLRCCCRCCTRALLALGYANLSPTRWFHSTIPPQAPNVRYLCSAAEYLSEHLPPRSVDLIAMAETLHWCAGSVVVQLLLGDDTAAWLQGDRLNTCSAIWTGGPLPDSQCSCRFCWLPQGGPYPLLRAVPQDPEAHGGGDHLVRPG